MDALYITAITTPTPDNTESTIHIPPVQTIVCDSETCRLNPKGICLAPLLTGKPPTITEDEGCLDYIVTDT